MHCAIYLFVYCVVYFTKNSYFAVKKYCKSKKHNNIRHVSKIAKLKNNTKTTIDQNLSEG